MKNLNMNRNKDAHLIIAGACNPVAVAGTLHKAMLDCMGEGKDHAQIVNDSAVVLIFDHLAQLMGYPGITDTEKFAAALKEAGV